MPRRVLVLAPAALAALAAGAAWYEAAEARRPPDHRGEFDPRGGREGTARWATEAVADDLAAGRVTLAEAVDAMGDLTLARPGLECGLASHYQGLPRASRIARFAVVRARQRLADHPARVADLEAEYRATFADPPPPAGGS